MPAWLVLATCLFAASPDPPIHSRSRAVLNSPVSQSSEARLPIGKPIEIRAPLGLPPVPIPDDNPPTAETVALGRKLFFDPVFSRDGKISCASCHDPKAGMSDPRPVSEGVAGKKGTRNAPSILNVAYASPLFWDGRAATLEKQAEMPVGNPLEMNHSLIGVARKLMASPEYVRLFAKAWGEGPVSYEMVAKSLASYERTLVSGNSPFDRYYYGGEKTAMNESAIRGLKLFLDPSLKAANCVSCHRLDAEFSTFTEPRFHNTGVSMDLKTGAMKDLGRYDITGNERHKAAFRSLTLRNIALTAPYMHDGSMKTLEEVMDFYFDGGRPNVFISNDMPAPGLPNIPKEEQAQAKKDLVEFLKALTGDMPPGAAPPE